MASSNNTILYLGVGLLAFMFLSNNKSEDEVKPKFASGDNNSQLAKDLISGKVVLDIENVPDIPDTFDMNHKMICLDMRAMGISPIMYPGGTRGCEDAFVRYG